MDRSSTIITDCGSSLAQGRSDAGIESAASEAADPSDSRSNLQDQSSDAVPVVVERDGHGAIRITYAARGVTPRASRLFEPHGHDWVLLPDAVERALEARFLPGGAPRLPTAATTLHGWHEQSFRDAQVNERISRSSAPCFRMVFDPTTMAVLSGNINAVAARLIGFNMDL